MNPSATKEQAPPLACRLSFRPKTATGTGVFRSCWKALNLRRLRISKCAWSKAFSRKGRRSTTAPLTLWETCSSYWTSTWKLHTTEKRGLRSLSRRSTRCYSRTIKNDPGAHLQRLQRHRVRRIDKKRRIHRTVVGTVSTNRP